jgi:hypothetical protein
MSILRLSLPYLFLLYFAFKSLKNPLFLLGIPFLFVMGNSIFLDTAKIFHTPGKYGSSLLQFIWMMVLWIISKMILQKKYELNFNKSNLASLIDYCIIALAIITVIDYLRIIPIYPIDTDIGKEFFIDISLFIGYFLIKNWVINSNEKEIEEFLFSIVTINAIASVLFILHQGLHYQIYLVEDEQMTAVEHGQLITRTFIFFPQFLTFSIIFSLNMMKKKTVISLIFIVINLLVIFFSYTRSLVPNLLSIIFLYFTFSGIKRRSFKTILKNIFIYSALLIFGAIILFKVFPVNAAYFNDRFSELSEKKSSFDEDDNLRYRFKHTNEVISKIDGNNQFFGMGPVTSNQLSVVDDMVAATYDMVWAQVIFRWGFIGLLLFVVLYCLSGILSFRLYMNSEGIISDLSLVFLIFIISQIIESIFSFTFLSDRGISTGLWYFAMLMGLLGINRSKGLADIKKI